jgi:hypothetical protein
MIKFTDYLNKKKNNTVSLQDTVSPTVGKAPSYTDALSILSKNKKTPIGAEMVQLTEQTPIYPDTARPGELTPNAGGQNTNPVSVPAPVPAQPAPTQRPMSFEEYVLSVKSKADDQYKRDLITARNTYDQSRSGYGTQAAALGNMGLTGSGYSAYLDSKAYGQMQADKNAAARKRDDTKSALDVSYMDYLNQQNANKTNAYANLYSTINYSTTDTDIDNYGKIYGWSADEINALKTARNDRIRQYLDMTDYDKKLLDTIFPNGGAEYENYFNKLVTDAKNTVSGDMFGQNDKDTETATYNSVKETIQQQIDKTTDEAEKQELQKILTTLENAYNDVYNNPGVVSLSIKFRADTVHGDNKYDSGDRFTLKGKDGKYVVEFTGAETPKEVKEWAARNKDITDGTVFKYNNNYYVRVGDEIYQFRQRGDRSGEWAEFEKAFNGSDSKKEED